MKEERTAPVSNHTTFFKFLQWQWNANSVKSRKNQKNFKFLFRICKKYDRMLSKECDDNEEEIPMYRMLSLVLALLLVLVMLTGCDSMEQAVPLAKAPAAASSDSLYLQVVPLSETVSPEETEALQDSPAAVASVIEVSAPGTKEKRSDKAVIDYSNTEDGYVMVQFLKSTEKKLKCRVAGPTTTYTYTLTPKEWETFSLSDGNGKYSVTVYENVSGTKYATVLSVSFSVELRDEFAPFLLPNQYVDYQNAEKTSEKAAELTKDLKDALRKVEAVYDYVVGNISYDKQLAKTVKSGYLPVLDDVLEKQSGICFDYAALMAGMLRSQGVPCKLVVGYAGSAYHAWISVWTEEDGWVDGIIFFDGKEWKRMDPTFASSGNASAEIMKYIGNGENYSAKYLY